MMMVFSFSPSDCSQFAFGDEDFLLKIQFLGSIMVSIPACHTGDRGSIPRRGDRYWLFTSYRKIPEISVGM